MAPVAFQAFQAFKALCFLENNSLCEGLPRWTIPEISWAGVNQQEAEAQGLHFGVVQAAGPGGGDSGRSGALERFSEPGF